MEHCKNPRHKQHLNAFVRKYATADKNAEFAIIDVDPKDWAVDIVHPQNNTVKCCQMCSIQEDIKRVTSPGWFGQPAPYDRPFLSMDGQI